MSDKATPRLPLHASRDSNGTYGITAANGEPIAYCRHPERAALIITAVNSYDALRQALEDVNEELHHAATGSKQLSEDDLCSLCGKLEAALELAKGEPCPPSKT